MKTIRWAWLPLFMPLLLAARPAPPALPEPDIAAVVSATPLSDTEAVPGLLAGERIMDALQGALVLVRGGVPEAASPGLETLVAELRQLRDGDGPAPPLPASYRSDGELWLPVGAQLLRVRLDAPDLPPMPRPRQAGEPIGERVGDLPAKARRLVRLPLGSTLQLVEQVHTLVNIGQAEQAAELLEAALQGTQTSLALEHRELILAYYGVASALAAPPRWDELIRDRLRRAAEALDGEAGVADLADRLQALADELTPDPHALQDLAMALRKRINVVAGPSPIEGRS